MGGKRLVHGYQVPVRQEGDASFAWKGDEDQYSTRVKRPYEEFEDAPYEELITLIMLLL